MLKIIEKDHKFPLFQVDADLHNLLLTVPKKKIFPWIVRLSNRHYKRTYYLVQEQKAKTDLSDDTIRKCFEYYEKAVEYLKENLVMPKKAKWFNDHSTQIFEHLEKMENE